MCLIQEPQLYFYPISTMLVYFHITNLQNQSISIFFLINLHEEYFILCIFQQNMEQIMEVHKMNNFVHVLILISESYNLGMTHQSL